MRSEARERSVAALAAVLAAAALWLPWWTAAHPTYEVRRASVTDVGTERLTGVDVIGTWATVLVVFAAVAAVVAVVLASRAMWWWVVAAGVAQSTIALVVVVSWGFDFGSIATLVCGLVALVIAARALVGALHGRLRAVPAVLLLLAVPVAFVPTDTLGATDDRDPFERVAASGAGAVVPVDGGVGMAAGGEVRTVGDGRPSVLASFGYAGPTALGVVGDRLAVFWPRVAEDIGEVRLVRLGAPDARQAVVTGVTGVTAMSARGVLLVATGEDDDLALRRLDVTRLTDGAQVPVTELTAVQLPDAERHARHDELSGEVLLAQNRSRVAAIDRTNLLGARVDVVEPGGDTWHHAAGGIDRSCGLTARGPDSYLDSITALTGAGADGWWLAAESRVLHLADDGTLRAIEATGLGEVRSALVIGRDLVLGTQHGVFRLPDPRSRLTSLPAPAGDCVGNPEVAGPAPLTPLAVPALTRDLLDVSGRHAEVTDGVVEVVAADGTRTALGPRQGADDVRTQFVPDGSGGLWWLETIPPAPGGVAARQLVHATAAGEVTRQAPVPGAGERINLATDLSGAPPLVGTCPPVRLAGGAEQEVPAIADLYAERGLCPGVVIGRDGRGWSGVNEAVYTFDPAGAGEATQVIGGDGDAAVPVAVQLAKGTAPADLSPNLSDVGIDSTGRPLVLSDDVLLGIAPDGSVSVLAQDERLLGARLVTVEGGSLAVLTDGTVHLIGY